MGVMVGHPNTYFGQWIPHRSDLLIGLESEAEQQDIPIVGPVVGKLLYLLAKIKGARRIVELGTATGYSAIFMGNACRSNHGHLTTFEAEPEMAARAVCIVRHIISVFYSNRIGMSIANSGTLFPMSNFILRIIHFHF